jgi:syntaxin 18
MDLTPLFNSSLAARQPDANHKPLRAHPFEVDTLNSFLREAYQIHGHIADLTRYIRSIRAPYLALGPTHRAGPASSRQRHGRNNSNGGLYGRGFSSNHDNSTSMTDSQRKRIEEETQSALKTISTTLRNLSQVTKQDADFKLQIAEKARSKRSLGALGRWAAGMDTVAKSPEEIEEVAIIDTERLHREAIIFYLQKRLEIVSEAQRDMVAVRLQRTVEKNKSVLYKANLGQNNAQLDALLGGQAITKGKLTTDGGYNESSSGTRSAALREDDERKQTLDSLLSPEQVQMFEQEQEDMVRYFNSELQKIRYVHPIHT